MNSGLIIKELYRHFLGKGNCHAAVHNNTNMLGYCGESDFLAVTKNGMIHEVEVKISRSDFKADFKKVDRHLHLSGIGIVQLDHNAPFRNYRLKYPVQDESWPKSKYKVSHVMHSWQIICHQYKPENYVAKCRPNFFWYAVPEGLVRIDEVPDYCGLIEVGMVNGFARMSIVRKAPRIHKENIFTDAMKMNMLRSLSFKNI